MSALVTVNTSFSGKDTADFSISTQHTKFPFYATAKFSYVYYLASDPLLSGKGTGVTFTSGCWGMGRILTLFMPVTVPEMLVPGRANIHRSAP